MNHLKLYEEFEEEQLPFPLQPQHPGFLQTYEETECWLDSMGINKLGYKIDPKTLIVSVGDSNITNHFQIVLIGHDIEYIPVQFGKVGLFDVTSCGLKSLKGGPTESTGFNCSMNNLTTLEYMPNIITGKFICNNNKLVTMEHIPKGLKPKLRSNNYLTWGGRHKPEWGDPGYKKDTKEEVIEDLINKLRLETPEIAFLIIGALSIYKPKLYRILSDQYNIIPWLLRNEKEGNIKKWMDN